MTTSTPLAATDHPFLGTDLVLAMLAERVPLLFFPDLARSATSLGGSDFTAADVYC